MQHKISKKNWSKLMPLLSILPFHKHEVKEVVKSTYYWDIVKYTRWITGPFYSSPEFVTYVLSSSNRSEYLEYKDSDEDLKLLLNRMSDEVARDFLDAEKYLELISDLSDKVVDFKLSAIGNNTDRLQARNYARKQVTTEREILSEALLMRDELASLLTSAEEGLG